MKMNEKRILIVTLVLIFVAAVLATSLFVISRTDMYVTDSPDGKYQVVGYLFDKGGWGYSGSFYVKKSGITLKWHKLCDGPAAVEWINNSEIKIYQANPIDGNWQNNAKENHEWIYYVK